MSTPKIFRVTLEVSNLDEAAAFYAKLLETPGKRHPGARHYFDCGGAILALQDPTQGGLTPTPSPKSLYFATDDVDAAHARAKKLGALAPFMVRPGSRYTDGASSVPRLYSYSKDATMSRAPSIE